MHRTLVVAVATAIALIALPPGADAELQWTIVAADTTGDVGRFCSIAVDTAGRPHIAYRASLDRSGWYARLDGATWTHESVLESSQTFGTGTTTSIAVRADGLVGIVLGGPENDAMAYVERVANVWDFQFADPPPGSGMHSSLTFDGKGQFHIAYQKGALVHRRGEHVAWAADTIDAGGQWPSIRCTPDGNPRVAYYSGGGANAKYAEYDGSAWSRTFIDTAGAVGLYSSLAVDSTGAPHVSYAHSAPVYDLHYAVRVTGAWQLETVDTTGTTGYYTSIATDSGNSPWIAYTGFLESGAFAIKLATRSASAWTITTIDTVASLERVGLAIDAVGRKHLAYYDAGPGDLMYAVGQDPTDVPRFEVMKTLSLAIAPNPVADGLARIALTGPERGNSTVSIYDVGGRSIRTIALQKRTDAAATATWDGTDERGRPVAPGVYLLRAEVGGRTAARRLVVVR